MSLTSPGKLHGKIVRQRKVGGFRVLELAYDPLYDAGRHDHPLAHLALSLSGIHEERIDGKTVVCDASTTIYRPAGVTHGSKNRERQNRVLAVELGSDTVGHGVPSLRFDEPHTSEGGALTQSMRRLHVELGRDDPFSNFAVYGLVLEALAALGRERPVDGRPNWVRVVEEAVRDSREVPSVRELATMAGLSETTFCRHFRQHFRQPVGQYLRKRRFEKAVRLLESSDLTLSEIAYETGFVDQSHFTNALKAELGVTPSRYRRERCASSDCNFRPLWKGRSR